MNKNEVYQINKKEIERERRMGYRIVGRRGYDIINNSFFVEEKIVKGPISEDKVMWFDRFKDYFDYIDGDIYENSCYYQWKVPKELKEKLDYGKLFQKEAFITVTIDDEKHNDNSEDEAKYAIGEKRKKQVREWIKEAEKCKSGKELLLLEKKFNHNKLFVNFDVWNKAFEFVLWNYISNIGENEEKFIALMDYLSYFTCSESIVRETLGILDNDKVINNYKFINGSKGTFYHQLSRLRRISKAIRENRVKKSVLAYYDDDYHYYSERTIYELIDQQDINFEGGPFYRCYRFFETIEEFVEYRNGDLYNTDLSNVRNLEYDFSSCKIYESTILPIRNEKEINYGIYKKFLDGKYIVGQYWCNYEGKVVRANEMKFEYFCDFVYYLKGDLSGANLIMCDGFANIMITPEIKLDGIMLNSRNCKKMNMKYKLQDVIKDNLTTFSISEKNEKETLKDLEQNNVDEIYKDDYDELLDYDKKQQKFIYYVSDLHLLHKLKEYGAESKEDINYVLYRISINIVNEATDLKLIHPIEINNIVLIAGDVSSNLNVFRMFVEILRKVMDIKRKNLKIVFTLGNHELWPFEGSSINDIVKRYKEILDENEMYLLHNSIFYVDLNNNPCVIDANDILSLNNKELYDRIRRAKSILFGGIGFSGYNKEFNANNGIYQNVISRKEEVAESKKFEKIYNKVLEVMPDRNVVVCTHMPMDCWRKKVEYNKNFYYISGHTHRNVFYDDGETRIYADNQIGYGNNSIHLKWIEYEECFDYFGDYEDGVYNITGDDYINFYRGLNRILNYNDKKNELYLLKKMGYYCFIYRNKSGKLGILNGGQKKTLLHNDINYYYQNMDKMIASIEKPLSTYTEYQNIIAEEIRKIGGDGNIHGCIIDIDFYNHVYVNPIDKKITAYYASDIVNKVVYSDVPALLKKECPTMYKRYQKHIKDKSINALISTNPNEELISDFSRIYLATDIYRVSREIFKMQKLNDRLLVTWLEKEEKVNKVKENTLKENIKAIAIDHEKEWIGKSTEQKVGGIATIISYKGARHIDVQFDDGHIIKDTSIEKWRKGILIKRIN